ncbi:hypothetical protein F5882DRAFT_460679 [Hyaloscypha sp. PMI_1271]|nr:hypothetical protein F5882DRAFT_460679 [Hyaloscypha sp. PMI_1271]
MGPRYCQGPYHQLIGYIRNNVPSVTKEFRPSSGHRRLFIIEDLTAEVIEALGSRFRIDPAFFASHTTHKIRNTDDIKLDFNVHRNIWLELSDEPSRDENNRDEDLNFGLSRYKASFWSCVQDGIEERSWDAVMLVDPPYIRHLHQHQYKRYRVLWRLKTSNGPTGPREAPY